MLHLPEEVMLLSENSQGLGVSQTLGLEGQQRCDLEQMSQSEVQLPPVTKMEVAPAS